MKVLHIVNTYAAIGGIETYVIDLLPKLETCGIENALIYRRKHPRTPAANGQAVFHIPETENVERDRQRIVQLVKSQNPDVIYLHDVYDPGLVPLVADIAPAVGYVHIFYPVCPGLGKLFRRGNKVCTRAYGPGCVPMIYLRRCASARHPRSVARIMKTTQEYLAAYRQLPGVLVASNYMQTLMVQNGIPADRLRVLPYFIPTPDVSELTVPGGHGELPYIMFAGRLEYEKGLDYLLRALPLIQTPHRLFVAGDGSRRDQYMDLAQMLGVADRVEFVPWLSKQDLEEAYRRTVVTVMPTIMPEPFGKVGVEAMANGRPVVAFNVGGIPDWLKDGDNGFLVPPRDVKQLAARLDQLLCDPKLAAAMGANGRRYVEKNYGDDQHLNRLITILKNVADK